MSCAPSHIPNEFGRAVVGSENIVNGFSKQELENEPLVLKLEATMYRRRSAGANGRDEFEQILPVWRVNFCILEVVVGTVHVCSQQDREFGAISCG